MVAFTGFLTGNGCQKPEEADMEALYFLFLAESFWVFSTTNKS